MFEGLMRRLPANGCVDPVEDAKNQRGKVMSVEGVVQGDHLVEDAPYSPHVALLVVSGKGSRVKDLAR